MPDPDYQIFYDSAGFYIHAQAGCLQVSGAHQVEFLQRQTTNDLHLISENRVLLTALTTPAARLLDLFYVLPGFTSSDPSIQVISLTGNGKGMAAYLKSRIFFMDQVTVTDQSQDFAQISLGGPNAADLLARAGLSHVPQPGEYITTEISNVEVRLLGEHLQVGFPYRLLIPTTGLEAIRSALLGSGAAELSPQTYDVLRIEAGIPAAAHELTDAYTPLELNLEAAISSTKGCYTGQEIIARQRTYDKVTRKLVGLRLSALVRPGAEILAAGRQVGSLTSSALSPHLGAIGLAVLRRPSHEPGTQVEAKTNGSPVSGVVVELPFNH